MNRNILFALGVVFFSASVGVNALTTKGAPFNVTLTLIPRCAVDTAATNMNFGTYIPFQGSNVTPTSTASFKCTPGFAPISVSLDSGTVADNQVSGTLRGLAYTIGIGSIAGSTAVGSAAPGNVYSYTLSGFMAGGQGGNATDPNSKPHTLYLIF